METKHQNPSSLPSDLIVTVQRFSKIFPPKKTEGDYMFISNIDIAANFNTGIISFFDANPKFPPKAVVEKFESRADTLLSVYKFLAGRLRPDPQSGRLAIECNSAWVGLAVASSELSLSQLGNLSYLNRAFRQLAVPLYEISSPEDQPLCALQVTSFTCGGFALCVSINHLILDGIASRVFLENMASIIADEPLALPPYTNRQLLAARSPPRVTCSHQELFELSLPKGDKAIYMKIFQNVQENLKNKIFQLSEEDIGALKLKATTSLNKRHDVEFNMITRFNVIMAHIWRCKALAENINNEDMEKTSTMLYAADLRPRLNPPLPISYTGNAIISAYATTSIHDLKTKPFHYLVNLISQGAERITDEYARSHIDWLEVHKGFPHGDFYVSPWWKLGLSDVNYLWGRPKYTFPLLHFRRDLILLLSQVNSEEVVTANGVNVFVALPREEMAMFHQLFYRSYNLDSKI